MAQTRNSEVSIRRLYDGETERQREGEICNITLSLRLSFSPSGADRSTLVLKMPPAREDHRNLMLVGRRNDFLIAHAATRLNDGRNAGCGCSVNRVGERK